MRKSLLAFAFSLATAVSPAAFAADGLFSQVPIQSVFTQPGGAGTPSAASPNPAPVKLTGAAQLTEALRKGGFETKEVTGQVVSTKTKLDKWTFPVVVTVSDDQSQLWVVLLLSTVKNEKEVPADKLLNLMNASRQYSPAYFAYSTKHKRTELYRAVSNQGVTGDVLRTEIDRLATIAKETQTLWSFTSSASPAPAAPSAPAASAPATSSPTTASPLAGRWSAAKSDKEGFAMQLKADGTFVLVHVNQGKQNRSTGKFTLSGPTLTLSASDGTRIVGSVSGLTATEFKFLPQNSTGKTGLTFKRSAQS